MDFAIDFQQDFKTERNTILNAFSFLSKGIVIHTIRIILSTWNVLYYNARGIENFWHYVQCCFFVRSFVCFKNTPCQFHWNASVRLDGQFHFKSTLLKCSKGAETDRISKNFTPNQYTYAKTEWASIVCHQWYIWYKLIKWTKFPFSKLVSMKSRLRTTVVDYSLVQLSAHSLYYNNVHKYMNSVKSPWDTLIHRFLFHRDFVSCFWLSTFIALDNISHSTSTQGVFRSVCYAVLLEQLNQSTS